MGLPSQWFQPLQKNGSVDHPFKRMAWYLQDASEEIPESVMDNIVMNLEQIEKGELVQEQINKLKEEEDREMGIPKSKKRSAYFRQAYQNIMSEAQIINVEPTIEDEERMFFRVKEEMKRLRSEDKKAEVNKKS